MGGGMGVGWGGRKGEVEIRGLGEVAHHDVRCKGQTARRVVCCKECVPHLQRLSQEDDHHPAHSSHPSLHHCKDADGDELQEGEPDCTGMGDGGRGMGS